MRHQGDASKLTPACDSRAAAGLPPDCARPYVFSPGWRFPPNRNLRGPRLRSLLRPRTGALRRPKVSRFAGTGFQLDSGAERGRNRVHMKLLSRLLTLVAMSLVSHSLSNAAELRIGMIGLDTSHAIAFTKLINDARDPSHVPGGKVIAAFK